MSLNRYVKIKINTEESIYMGKLSYKILVTTFIVLAVFLLSSTGWTATYYVSNTGCSDSNPGTSETLPWCSISKINSMIFQSGDNIYFKRGDSWTGQLLTVSSSGSSGNYITYGAYGAGNKPIIGSVYADGKSYIIIQDFNIGLNRRTGITVIHNSKYGIIRRNTVDSGNRDWNWGERFELYYEGIQLGNGAQYWEVYNNTVIGWVHSGIVIENGNANYQTLYNKVHHNHISAPNLSYGRGFSILGAPEGAISYNEFYNNYITDTSVASQIQGDYNKIYGNIIDTMVYTPVKTGAMGQGINIAALAYGFVKYNQIYNNIFYNVPHAGMHVWGFSNFIGNEIKNNIVLNCGWGPVPSNFDFLNVNGISLAYRSNSGQSNIFENNIVYNTNNDASVHYNGSIMSISEFNNMNGQNGDVIKNTMMSNPLFVDFLNGNFKLQSNSPAIDAGMDVGILEDYAGVASPVDGDNNGIVKYDIGVYEYNGDTPPGSDNNPPAAPPSLVVE
jgi:hypothetical protein